MDGATDGLATDGLMDGATDGLMDGLATDGLMDVAADGLMDGATDGLATDGLMDVATDGLATDGLMDGAIDISVGAKHCGQKSRLPVIIYIPQCFALTSSFP
jgi:hypothetical protein